MGPSEHAPLDQNQTDSSDGVSSSSSEAGMWIPDEPYGDRNRLVKALRELKPGFVFHDEYADTSHPCFE